MIIEGSSQKMDEQMMSEAKVPSKNDKLLSESEETDLAEEPDCDLCNPFMQKHRVLSPDPTLREQLMYAISCPPHGKVGTAMTWILLLPIVWGVMYAITGDEALPGGNLFSIVSLLLLAQIGGYIASLIHLPPLLGMLLVGIALRSLPGLDVIGTNIDQKWSATLRKTALVVILTRAGLGLDPKALREMSLMVLRLGVLPNVVEMCVVAIVTHFLLAFPWLWSFMLGFILAGVSPSVVVPCMLSLSDNGYGVDKGVPTLVIAGLSVDNVISISGFGVLLGVIFSEGSIAWQALKGPIEVLIGFLFALIMGSVCWYLPNRHDKGSSKLSFALLFCCGLLAIFGSIKVGFGGAGPIGCLGAAFVAGIGWRKQGCMGNNSPMKKNFNFVWQFFLPLLFGLIGTEIKISSALNGSTVSYGLLTLVASLSFRILTTYFCVHGGNLNLKERIFVALAWLPKATIQAAFGSTALDVARSFNPNPETETPEEALGKQVLTIAVLVIIVAAPLGAIAIMLSAPRLLKRKIYSKNGITEEGTEMQIA